MTSKIAAVEKILKSYGTLSCECEQLEREISSLNKEYNRTIHSKVYTDERRKRIADAAQEAATALSELQLVKIAQQIEIENLINRLPSELAYVVRSKYMLMQHTYDIAREMSMKYIKTCSERQIYRYLYEAKELLARELKKSRK